VAHRPGRSDTGVAGSCRRLGASTDTGGPTGRSLQIKAMKEMLDWLEIVPPVSGADQFPVNALVH
jgi:hypothetical protein